MKLQRPEQAVIYMRMIGESVKRNEAPMEGYIELQEIRVYLSVDFGEDYEIKYAFIRSLSRRYMTAHPYQTLTHSTQGSVPIITAPNRAESGCDNF